MSIRSNIGYEPMLVAGPFAIQSLMDHYCFLNFLKRYDIPSIIIPIGVIGQTIIQANPSSASASIFRTAPFITAVINPNIKYHIKNVSKFIKKSFSGLWRFRSVYSTVTGWDDSHFTNRPVVPPRRIELPFEEWKSSVLTIRRRWHVFQITNVNIEKLFGISKFIF